MNSEHTAAFHTTRWSVVRSAAVNSDSGRAGLLDLECESAIDNYRALVLARSELVSRIPGGVRVRVGAFAEERSDFLAFLETKVQERFPMECARGLGSFANLGERFYFGDADRESILAKRAGGGFAVAANAGLPPRNFQTLSPDFADLWDRWGPASPSTPGAK